MSHVRGVLALALLCLAIGGRFANSQPAGVDTPFGSCPMAREQADGLDFSKLITACDSTITSEERCSGCLCTFGEVFAPVLATNGVEVDVASLDQEAVTNALMACFDVVVPAMEAAGLDLMSLSELAGCPEIPECLLAGN